MQADLTSDFARYRFLLDMMEGNTDWEQANTVMAVYQGYIPEDEGEGDGTRPEVRKGWAQMFHGGMGAARLTPPDLSTAEGLVEALEADFPDDPDLLDGLEVIVETVYGGEAKRVRKSERGWVVAGTYARARAGVWLDGAKSGWYFVTTRSVVKRMKREWRRWYGVVRNSGLGFEFRDLKM